MIQMTEIIPQKKKKKKKKKKKRERERERERDCNLVALILPVHDTCSFRFFSN